MTAYLHHVTLDTGHVRRSYRREVSDEATSFGADLARRSLHAGAAIPVMPEGRLAPFSIQCVACPPALLATISGPRGPRRDGAPHAGPMLPVLTFAVAPRSTVSQKLWDMIARPEDPAERPAAPWLAARIWPTAAAYHEDLIWMADMSRCIAWGWIEDA